MSVSRRLGFALGFIALSFVVYNLNGRCIPTHDTLPARLIPVALLTRGTSTLDQFGPPLFGHPGVTYFYMHDRHGRRVSIYPMVVPLAVTPFFIPAAAALERGDALDDVNLFLELTEKIAASAIAAASVAVVWLLLSHWASLRTAVLLTIAYAFATQTWMISSQALWQHGMSELLLAALLLALSSTSAYAGGVAGALTGLLVANRPTNAMFAAAAAIYLLRSRHRGFRHFLVGMAPFIALLVLYNVTTFGTAFGGYGGRVVSKFTIANAFDGSAALLFSPGRGLFVFAPFLLFLFALISPTVRHALPAPVRSMLLAAGLQLVMYGAWREWTGGECYGPRFLTDMTPVLVFALVPVLERMHARGQRLLFATAMLWSIAVQSVGAFCYQMGGSGTPRNQWSPASNQTVIELRAGPAPPSFSRWWNAIT